MPQAYAGNDNVQINLDSLKTYNPPPMFGGAPEKKTQEAPVTIYPQGFDENDVVQPSVSDILKQLENTNTKEPSPPPVPAIEKPQIAKERAPDKPKRVYARPAVKNGNVRTTAKEVEAPEVFEPLNYIMQFEPGGEGLTPEQEAGIRAAVLPAMQIKGVKLLIYAYATGNDGTESEARRVSLHRALLAKTFLAGLNVDERSINILALGDRAPIPPENKLVFVTKM